MVISKCHRDKAVDDAGDMLFGYIKERAKKHFMIVDFILFLDKVLLI